MGVNLPTVYGKLDRSSTMRKFVNKNEMVELKKEVNFVKMTLYNLLNDSKFIILQKDIFSTLSDMIYLNPRNISLGLTYNF